MAEKARMGLQGNIYIYKKIRQRGDKIRLRSGGKMYEEEGA